MFDGPAAHLPEHMSGQAAVERMRPGDVELRRHRAPDAGAEDLGHSRELALRLRMRYAVSHDDHGILSTGQHLRGVRDQRRLRRHARLRNHRRQHRFVVGLIENVLRDGEETGPTAVSPPS